MNEKEARKWIKDKVFTSTFDARTLESPCKEIVTYLNGNPDDKAIFAKALSDFIENENLTAQQHVENTAYLVVNLRSRDALEKFIAKLHSAEDNEGIFRTFSDCDYSEFSMHQPGESK